MSKGVEATPPAEGTYHMHDLPWLRTMYHFSPLVILSIMAFDRDHFQPQR